MSTQPVELPTLTLGVHVQLEGEWYLPVRIVDQTTLHEHKTGTAWIDEEKFVELRDKEGKVRFVILFSERKIARRDPGPCKGIKPYYWKEGKEEF